MKKLMIIAMLMMGMMPIMGMESEKGENRKRKISEDQQDPQQGDDKKSAISRR
jgi:hypothetical protein